MIKEKREAINLNSKLLFNIKWMIITEAALLINFSIKEKTASYNKNETKEIF